MRWPAKDRTVAEVTRSCGPVPQAVGAESGNRGKDHSGSAEAEVSAERSAGSGRLNNTKQSTSGQGPAPKARGTLTPRRATALEQAPGGRPEPIPVRN